MSTTPTGNLVKFWPTIPEEPTPQQTALHTRLLFNAANDHDQAITLLDQKLTNAVNNGIKVTSTPSSSGSVGTGVVPGNTPAIAHEFITAYDASAGMFSQAQPAFTDISGTATAAQVPALSALTGAITAGQLPVTGISVTITTAALTALGTQGSMTFTDGILTAQTQAT